MSSVIQHFGDLKKQGRWLVLAAAAPAGLQLFSIAGPTGDLLYDLIKRVIINYQNVFSALWKNIGDIFQIELSIYKDQLTFSSLVLLPYIIRIRGAKFDSIFNDNERLLSYLNFSCIIFISGSISSSLSHPIRSEPWALAIGILPFSLIFLYLSWKSQEYDIEYPIVRTILFPASLVISILTLITIFGYSNQISRIFQPITTIFCQILESFSYAIAILFRVDGRYPFLYIVIFYLMIYVLNYFVVQIYPVASNWLSSVGA